MLEWTGLTPRKKLFRAAGNRKNKTGGAKNPPDPLGDPGDNNKKKQKAGRGQSTHSPFAFLAHTKIVLRST